MNRKVLIWKKTFFFGFCSFHENKKSKYYWLNWIHETIVIISRCKWQIVLFAENYENKVNFLNINWKQFETILNERKKNHLCTYMRYCRWGNSLYETEKSDMPQWNYKHCCSAQQIHENFVLLVKSANE